MKVTIYSTPTCPYCNQAKEFFKENKIKYEEIDVSEDQAKAQEMIKISDQMGVPVIVVNDEVIIGFDKKKLSELLGL